ncbi:MAG TPA: hypothetical protein VK698_30045 [Kofleriaceae bacterium]|nr:hypothetical protein [Kofleriaceae bacterium]
MKLRLFGILFGLFIALAPACGGDDDDDSGTIDSGAGGAADAATGGLPDAATGGTPDAATGGLPDAATGGGDGAVALSPEELCRQYESACGFGAPGRYESSAQCVEALRSSPGDSASLTCN